MVAFCMVGSVGAEDDRSVDPSAAEARPTRKNPMTNRLNTVVSIFMAQPFLLAAAPLAALIVEL
ncbi:MAG: hypothetical protein C0616_15195 [Desulfuromonas sp.]|nr:MAG: hypothetical protein C0616_15195 [Desulfuromonas sp.]